MEKHFWVNYHFYLVVFNGGLWQVSQFTSKGAKMTNIL